MLRFLAVTAIIFSCISARAEVVHDVEYYILKLQNRDKWAKEDQKLDRRLQLHLCRARAGHHCKGVVPTALNSRKRCCNLWDP